MVYDAFLSKYLYIIFAWRRPSWIWNISTHLVDVRYFLWISEISKVPIPLESLLLQLIHFSNLDWLPYHAMFSRRNLLKAGISLDIIISLITQHGLMKWQILLEVLFLSMFTIFSWILGKYERKYKSTKKSLPDFCWGNI